MTAKPSSEMKSAMSSSSSGSDRASVSGVASSGNDIEDRKSKSNSRMSCASDDSCAINELLEGRMDLSVLLPNSANPIVINVERRTPMLDLLVNISTQYRFNAANYTINAGDHEFKASTPIGTLDVNQISIVPKTINKTASLKNTTQSTVPFKTTFRLQVNLPRNQLMVMRVSPNATIAAIKQIICSEKALDANKYQLVRFGKSQGPQLLETNKSLAFYTINEVTLISNKSLAQMELEYGTPSSSAVMDMSSPRTTQSVGESVIRKPSDSMIISQSNPDFSTIDEKTELNHMTTSKQSKKRPAPPPPIPSSATLPTQKSSNKDENSLITENKNESNVKFNEKVSMISEDIVETAVLKVHKNMNHVRHNSGSDSSGYHESVLSSDSPESSSATGVHKSVADKAPNVSRESSIAPSNKSAVKKRRAPPPPVRNIHSHNCSKPVNDINDENNKTNDNMTEETKIVSESMSDVSLPLSTSSSSSGTASDLNNRSLSPIVITQDNGSSTPLQRSVNYGNSLNSESIQSSSPLEKSADNGTEELVGTGNKKREKNIEVKETSESPESGVSVTTNEDESHHESSSSPNPTSFEASIEENHKSGSDLKATVDESSSQSSESLPKEEVSCEAPAQTLAVSHEPDHSGHECSEQVMDNNITNSVDAEKSVDVNQITDEDSDDNHTNEVDIDPTLSDNGLDLETMSVPLPPPSPFQNIQHEDNSSSESPEEDQHFVDRINVKEIENINNDKLENRSSDSSEKVNKKIEISDKSVEIKTKTETNDSKEDKIKIITNSSAKTSNDDNFYNKEIEVTLQSLNEELDRLEDEDQKKIQNGEHLPNQSESEKQSNSVITNNNNNVVIDANDKKNTSEVKRTESLSKVEAIKSKFEVRGQSPIPTPSPRVVSPVNTDNKSNTRTQSPVTNNGKTTFFVNTSQSPVPRSVTPSSETTSVSPINEEKISITEEVRQISRPRVRLTNFSIGSYKKEVDIYDNIPSTTPVVKSSMTLPLIKKEEKIHTRDRVVIPKEQISQNRSKVEITATSTTAMTTSVTKTTTPVIQTLSTNAPKINRIQSWSGQKSVTLEQKNIKQPIKSNERFVSQIAINKEVNNESNEDLRSPHLAVQSLIAKTEDRLKNRSPSPMEPSIPETNKEKVTISIKPGLESIIRSNSKQNSFESINNRNNSREDSSSLSEKPKVVKAIQIDDHIVNSKQVSKPSNPSPVPPPVPPPIPPPIPQSIPSPPPLNNSLKSNTKIFHTKGWSSDKVSRSEVPKVKHVEPPATANVRDQLLNEIKNFGGKNTLKKVSNNSSWKLEVNTIRT